MKTKKPRSGKAAKPAARVVRRVARSKPKVLRRKASPAKRKVPKRKAATKLKLPAKGKPRTTAKLKRVTRRVIRKPRAKTSPISVAGKKPVAPLVAARKRVSKVLPSKPAKATGLLKANQPTERAARTDPAPRIPPILLEGDEPVSPTPTGPGEKYVLGPTAPAGHSGPDEGALPEAYGTGKLSLTARDPHWLYAHWDLTLDQQRRYNALAADHHLVVRVYRGAIGEQPVTEVHVHPESRHWFIHVERADRRHVAELGYYRPRREWVTIVTSSSTVTPADTASNDQTVRFATIPPHVRLTQLAALAKQAVPADLPPADAARERALAELVAFQLMPQGSASSAGIPELVRGPGDQEISAAPLAHAAPLAGELESVSSPTAPAELLPSGFWFNVNAELVLYGATEADASVTLGGRPIQLRPDGTFSCRYALPDGDHTVTVSAMSAQGDLRQAELRFSRRTEHRGEVGAAPQDPSLKPPATQPS